MLRAVTAGALFWKPDALASGQLRRDLFRSLPVTGAL